jgi:ArsR family transcriptional regulator, cadmium/lead-responsive transcriptional repressor
MTTTSAALDTLERVGTALADPTRRRILLTLLAGPANPGALAEALGTTQPNVSNHLACLRGCGLVLGERLGRHVHYELASPRLAHALADLVAIELDIEEGHADLDGRRG